MNVARKDLCAELFKVSGWKDTNMYSYTDIRLRHVTHYEYSKHGGWWYSGTDALPAYDLGFLLRKLPQWIDKTKDPKSKLCKLHVDKESANYVDDDGFYWLRYRADTPENALAKLAIELIRQKVLKP